MGGGTVIKVVQIYFTSTRKAYVQSVSVFESLNDKSQIKNKHFAN